MKTQQLFVSLACVAGLASCLTAQFVPEAQAGAGRPTSLGASAGRLLVPIHSAPADEVGGDYGT